MRRIVARFISLALVPLLTLAAGRANAQDPDRSALLPADWQSCPPAAQPRRLPALSQLLDSAAVIERLRTIGASAEGAEVLLSFVFNGRGAPKHVKLTGHRTPEGLAPLVRDAIAAGVNAQSGSGIWGVRVYAALGGQPALSVERAQYCAPSVASNPETVGGTYVIRASPGQIPPRPRDYRMQLSISETGRLDNVTLVQSTGIRELDDQIERSARQMRFEPARIDGIPVASTMDFPRR